VPTHPRLVNLQIKRQQNNELRAVTEHRMEYNLELDRKWNIQYEKMVEFKRKNGHCPLVYEKDYSFKLWVATQRVYYAKNKMRSDRKALLDELGFIWRVETAENNEKQWRQHYKRLVEFQRKNGHCRIPSLFGEDKTLGSWVANQRKMHLKDKMPQGRKDLLDALNFGWTCESSDHKWSQQYEKLIEFKQKNCHCIVPLKYKEDEAFGRWVGNQRTLQKSNELRQDRKDLLNDLEFVWRAPSGRRKGSRISLAERRQRMATRTNKRGNAKDDGHDQEASSPSLVRTTRSSARKCSNPEKYVVKEEIASGWKRVKLEPNDDEGRHEEDSVATDSPDSDQEEIPAGWTRTKLEPDW
jgi:hypothetical protein